MTDAGKAMTFEEARTLAERFTSLVGDSCERLLVVGSIRRGRSEIHDVDLVAIPKIERRKGIFEGLDVEVNLLQREIEKLIKGKIVVPRKKKDGTTMVGEGVAFLEFESWPVDIYYAREETWIGLVQVRTGSARFNQSIATRALHAGKRLHADGNGIWNAEGTKRLDDGKTEESIFASLGMRYYRPEEREVPLSVEGK